MSACEYFFSETCSQCSPCSQDFFSVLLINKIGLKSYTLDRFIRIGLTCLFFSALFDILDGNFDLTLNHLWFLYYLFIFIIGLSFLYLFSGFQRIISKKLTIRGWMVILVLLIMIGQLSILINGNELKSEESNDSQNDSDLETVDELKSEKSSEKDDQKDTEQETEE